jgi:hypothetical protein
MNSTCFFSVIFPSNEKFINTFLTSLENQTVKEFDVVIINDGIEKYDHYFELFPNLNLNIYNYTSSIAGIRNYGLNKIIELGYKDVVFGDSDDYFSENRVELSLRSLNKTPIVFNDISTVDIYNNIIKENIWKSRFCNNKYIERNFISNKNVLGLGNSAINVNLLKDLIIPEDCIAIDWYIFNEIFKNNKAIFIEDTVTYYRQHQSNIVGSKSIKIDQLNNIVKIKKQHFDYFKDLSSLVHLDLEGFISFVKDENIANDYMEFIESKNINYFWWEETNYLIEFKKYEKD